MNTISEFLGFGGGPPTYTVNGVGEFTLDVNIWYIQKDISVEYPDLMFYLDVFDKTKLIDEQVKVVKETFKESTKSKFVSLFKVFPKQLYSLLLNKLLVKKYRIKFEKEVSFEKFNQSVDIMNIGLSSIKSGSFITYWYVMFDDMKIAVIVKNWVPQFKTIITTEMESLHLNLDKKMRGVNSDLPMKFIKSGMKLNSKEFGLS